jgi:hypothetical protein
MKLRCSTDRAGLSDRTEVARRPERCEIVQVGDLLDVGAVRRTHRRCAGHFSAAIHVLDRAFFDLALTARAFTGEFENNQCQARPDATMFAAAADGDERHLRVHKLAERPAEASLISVSMFAAHGATVPRPATSACLWGRGSCRRSAREISRRGGARQSKRDVVEIVAAE